MTFYADASHCRLRREFLPPSPGTRLSRRRQRYTEGPEIRTKRLPRRCTANAKWLSLPVPVGCTSSSGYQRLARWLSSEGLDCSAFFDHVTRLAPYPIIGTAVDRLTV